MEPWQSKMYAGYHHTLRLFGIPIFTLVVGIVFFAAIAGLIFGVSQRRRPAGKIAVIASASVLLLFLLAISFILLTIASGSMG